MTVQPDRLTAPLETAPPALIPAEDIAGPSDESEDSANASSPRHLPPIHRVLARDGALQIAAGVLFALCLPYLLPLISPEQLENAGWYFWDPILLLLTIGVIQHRLRSSEPPSGVLFWTYLSLALGFWLAGDLFADIVPAVRSTKQTSLVVDALYCVYYVLLVLATELRPDLSPRVPPRGREDQLPPITAVLFVLAVMVYFSVIPAQLPAEDYSHDRLPLLLYVTLDLFVASRFAYLASAARSTRWRLTYRLLFAALLTSAALAILQVYSLHPGSIVPQYFGTPWDLLWFLPFVAILLAARWGRHVQDDTEFERRRALVQGLTPRAWEPLVFYALAFPLLHLLLSFYGELDPRIRDSHEGLVILYFLGFGSAALVQTQRRDARRRSAERQLREREHHYRRLIEDHPDAILLEQDQAVVYANAAGRARFGLERLEARPSLVNLGLPESLPTDRAKPAVGEPPVPVEHELDDTAGRRLTLELTYSDILHQGRPAREVIARDVTALRRIRAENERMERLASLGKFSAAMAHEIRNPLAAIVMQSFFLSRQLDKTDVNLEILADLNAAVDRMQRVVDGVLAFVRPPKIETAPEDLVDILRSALLELRVRTNETQVEVRTDFRHRRAIAKVDADQILTVFVHVMNNALRAMPQGGILRLVTKERDGELQVRIEDTGDGITPSDLERVFEPFFSRRDDGAGLGLALVARILDQHGVSYMIDSTPSRGTRFMMRFTLLDSWSEPPRAEEAHHGA